MRLRTAAMFAAMTRSPVVIGMLVAKLFHNVWWGSDNARGVGVFKSIHTIARRDGTPCQQGPHRHTVRRGARLYDSSRTLQKAGLPWPRLVSQLPCPTPSRQTQPKNAAVVGDGADPQSLNDDELEGVMAHELSHVKNRDILVCPWHPPWHPWSHTSPGCRVASMFQQQQREQAVRDRIALLAESCSP